MRTDLIWRAVVPLAALVGLLAGAPSALTGSVALLGLALAAERLVALRGRGLGDRLLVGVGGGLVALVLTGLALDALGLGLRPATWAGALVVLALVGLAVPLVVSPQQPDAAPTPRAWGREALRIGPWVGVAVVVTVLAVRMSATSLSAADEPPLQLSFGEVSGTTVQVVVSSTDPIGPLELRTASGGNEVSYPLITLGRDGTSTTTLSLPRTGRFVISLRYPDQTTPLRKLVLDR